jgi:hypothetical protein
LDAIVDVKQRAFVEVAAFTAAPGDMPSNHDPSSRTLSLREHADVAAEAHGDAGIERGLEADALGGDASRLSRAPSSSPRTRGGITGCDCRTELTFF